MQARNKEVIFQGKVPKHLKVARALEKAIVAGELTPGERLAGEDQLAKQFGVSRGSVRKALSYLGEQNLVATRRGSGSFVAYQGNNIDSLSGWTKACSDSGNPTTTEILRCEIVQDPDFALTLRHQQISFLHLDRVRKNLAQVPVSLERSRVPARGRIAEVPEKGLISGSLAKTMLQADLIPAGGQQWAEVASLSEEDAIIMQVEPGTKFLRTATTVWDREGKFVEQVVSWLNPEFFRLHNSFGVSL